MSSSSGTPPSTPVKEERCSSTTTTNVTNPKSPEQQIGDTFQEIHRRKYMKLAYGIDLNDVKNEEDLEKALDETGTGTAVSTKRLTPAKWKHRVHGLKYWKTGDGNFKNIKEFRQAYSDCKNLRNGSREQVVQTNGEGTDLLYKVTRNKRTGEIEKKRVVHILETFDIIQEKHTSMCHPLSDSTKIHIDSTGFHNITRAEVKAFCDTCPTCIKFKK